MSITIGSIQTRNRIFLAPLSGVTDAPFRQIAHECGAGLVVSEMVASEELLRARHDMVRRARGAGQIKPFVIQLAGREATWMAEGAKLAADMGAEVIDINMGCPAREVTGGLSGSALMRDLDHATGMIAATVAAVSLPVTLKMRLGWDEKSINAPELAARAENVGVRMITVHGRTRCQFYKGQADWQKIRLVKQQVSCPVIANGDGEDVASVKMMLAQSGADGVMIGRASYGRPWWPGVLAEQLDPGHGIACPTLSQERQLIIRHHELMLENYGVSLGNKTARKHLGWTVMRLRERGYLNELQAAAWRSALLTVSDNQRVRALVEQLYDEVEARYAA